MTGQTAFVGSHREILTLATGLCVLLGCVIILGPVSLIIISVIFGLHYQFQQGLKGSLLYLAGGFVLIFLIGEGMTSAYWRERFGLVAQILYSNDARYLWKWITDLASLENAACWGVLLGGATSFGYEMWWMSPARAAYKKFKADSSITVVPVQVQKKLKELNSQPADIGSRTWIGVERQSGVSVSISDKSLNTHILITGTTGSGKTVATMNIVQSFMNRNLPIIYIDGKGELALAQKIAREARRQGQKTWLFSMVGESCKYNPLASGSYTANKDKLIALRTWSEEHYKKLAEGYLQLALKVLEQTGQRIDLITIADHLEQASLVSLVRKAERDKKLQKAVAQALMDEIGSQDVAVKHIEGLRAELRNLAGSDLRDKFEYSGTSGQLTLEQVIRENGLAYIVLSPLQYPVFADVIGKLVLNDLKSSIKPENPKKVLVVIDEFNTLAGEQVLNLLNQGRSMGLHIVLTIQSIADLGQKIGKNPELFIKQILANVNLYWVHRMNNPDDAELMASTLGTTAAISYTTQIDETGATGLGSARYDREFIAHPDAIKTLTRGESFFLDKNSLGSTVRLLDRCGQFFKEYKDE